MPFVQFCSSYLRQLATSLKCPSRLDSYFAPCLPLLRLDFHRRRRPSRRAPRRTRRWSTRQRRPRRCRPLVPSSSLSLSTRPPPCLRICRRRRHNHRHRQLVPSASCQQAEPVRLSLCRHRHSHRQDFRQLCLRIRGNFCGSYYKPERGVLMPDEQQASNL
jgi:hypothetical protein